MRAAVTIKHLDCDKCRQDVISAFDAFANVSNPVIDIDSGKISFDCLSHNAIEGFLIYLSDIGHPILDQPKIIDSVALELR